MNRKLTPNDVIYNSNLEENIIHADEKVEFEEFDTLYSNIKNGLHINDSGYNIYIVDGFSRDKLNKITNYISEVLNPEYKPMDICYITEDNSENITSLKMSGGCGNKLAQYINEIKKMYLKLTYEFYNEYENKEKEEIINSIQNKKEQIVNEIVEDAKKRGFQLKISEAGFNFIPIKDGSGMTEKEYELLDMEKRDNILMEIKELKKKAKKIFDKLKVVEEDELGMLKKFFKDFFVLKTQSLKEECTTEFCENCEARNFIDKICMEIENDLIKNYTINYENDEAKIIGILSKYYVNVIVDNNGNDKVPVIYEDDPNLENLIGSIKYESNNGTYITDISLIKAGSILKANGGCLIIRINNLLSCRLSYYYLKKILMSGMVDLNYNNAYIEAISLNGLKPEPIPIKIKVILIGNYESYNLLYNLDEDFRNLFKIKAEYNPLITVSDSSKKALVKTLNRYSSEGELKSLDFSAIQEISKYMSRKAENRNKYYYDYADISKVLTFSNELAKVEDCKNITGEHVRKVVYKEELIERQISERYKEGKILFEVEGSKIGQINGLSVIDLGYTAFGKPIRITCICHKGEGHIVDINKENSLSGEIHCKSISILKGLMNQIFRGHNRLPVDFRLCFEQLYGKLDGDSASVAEVVCMLSALSKIPIKQNIAVTGSINQFGEVQPIGGVNYKIEGFYKVCKMYDVIKCGVLIPESNVDSIVLNNVVEEEVLKGDFDIYSMKNIEDAVNVLMDTKWEDMIKAAKSEFRKYVGTRKH